MTDIVVAALYQFTPLPDFEAHKAPLETACRAGNVMGTILLADEGINGTIAGSRAGIDAVLTHIRTIPGCEALEHKESPATEMPFHRMKVRLKKEIVTMGVDGIDPLASVGTYVSPQDWNALISDPAVAIIDTRNAYECSIGTFKGAIDPETKSFRDFPEWFRAFKEKTNKTKFAMFCTGGIRCEKSTAFLKSEGIEEVFHLKGGILKYLETVPEDDSLWDGECFVFDQRVSVGHGLVPGPYDMCHACRMPLSDEEKTSEFYVRGVSCPKCHDIISAEQKLRFTERQKQIDLARARGKDHIGAAANPELEES